MRIPQLIACLAFVFSAAVSYAASAQPFSAQSFDVPTPERPVVWDFEMWCGVMQGYPAERCDARRGDDEEAYQAYVARTTRFATAREYKPWLGPMRVRKTNPGYYSPY